MQLPKNHKTRKRIRVGKAQFHASNKEYPMSLGVLNNLSAITAANNLNKTSNSLSTVLNQLSSGSKINSGSDDAAGLSLVDGLEANATALSQSETNSSEGVGLLTVADGALSQVTSLLNRAVTLATEASNGTLNSTQDTAANEEYQSILSEVSNIGSTTTYNDETVFGSQTDIYTGDSTLSGSSIDSLNIASLSSANVGDTSGVMSYSTGGDSSSSVFIDLGGTATTDGSTGEASIVVNTLSSSGSKVSTTITTGGNTGYANTADGMIDAINNSGLGITASYTTGKIAEGSTTGSATYGIEITGSVGTATNLSTSSDSGSLTAVGAAGDTLTGSITFQTGTGSTTTVKMADVAKAEGSATETTLAAYINDNTSLGVKADATSTSMTLTSSTTSDALNVTSNLTDSTTSTAISYKATAAHSVEIGTVTAKDTVTGTTADTAAVAGKTSTSSGIATISYADAAGTDLSGTNLSNQTNAESALTALNAAISNVAAEDGYIGAQINTLNSVSSVLSTQSENVTSAQNAVQATDYATATSEMSKYEILDQTGIAALAQANSVQQEVTKLLQ
jgi:flagellin